MTARTKSDAKHWSHDLTDSLVVPELSVSPAGPGSFANLDLVTEDGSAVAIKTGVETMRAVAEYVLSRFEGDPPLIRHPFTLIPGRPLRRDENYIARCDWPGCDGNPLDEVHRGANGALMNNAANEPDPDHCGLCGLYHGRRRPVNAEPRFIVTYLSAHADVGTFYATTTDPADPGEVQARWTIGMQAPEGRTGETTLYEGTRWSSYTQPALRALLRRGDLAGAYRYAAGHDLIDMIETGYISSLYADIEASTIEGGQAGVYLDWIKFAQEQDSFWKPATMERGSVPEPA